MQTDQATDIADASGPAPAIVRITSRELFHGQRDIVIVHCGREYRLHITKAGKLILTK